MNVIRIILIIGFILGLSALCTFWLEHEQHINTLFKEETKKLCEKENLSYFTGSYYGWEPPYCYVNGTIRKIFYMSKDCINSFQVKKHSECYLYEN